MSTIFYPGGCDENLSHICLPCPVPEQGRVRNLAFVHTSVAFTDITNPAEWKAQMLLNKIIIISNVNGTYDGGNPTIGNGFGSIPKRKTGNVFKLSVLDPHLRNNCTFYNTISTSFNWRVAWTSESLLQISESAALVLAKDPIAEPVDSERYWNVEIEFAQKNISCHTAIPGGIFLCEQTV